MSWHYIVFYRKFQGSRSAEVLGIRVDGFAVPQCIGWALEKEEQDIITEAVRLFPVLTMKKGLLIVRYAL